MAGAAGGCGASGSAQTAHSTAQPSGHSMPVALVAQPLPAAPAVGSMTRAQALAYGRAVNLTAADVPGTVASLRKKKRSHGREGREFARCTDAPRVPEIAEVKSPELTRGSGVTLEKFSSTVTVSSNVRLAFKEFAAALSAKVRACMTRVLRTNGLGSTGGRQLGGNVTLALLPTRIPAGATDGVGLRFAVAISPPHTGRVIPIYVDEIVLVVGEAEIGLQTSSVLEPVAPRTEEQLLSLLLERARASAPAA